MKRITFLFLLFLPVSLFAQQELMVPDETTILKATIDYQSPYYYPSLMLRYETGDTTLTNQDYHYLYYGFAYQDAYKPLQTITGEDRVLTLLEQYPVPEPAEAAEIVDAAKRVFMQDPFSPKNLNFMAYAYAMMGDSLNAKINADRVEKILWVIDHSGTGKKENSPKHILWFSHANDYLGSKELSPHSRMIRSRTVEYVHLAKNKEKEKGYYFDFGRMYWNAPENPERNTQRGGFELNGIRLGKNRNTTTPGR